MGQAIGEILAYAVGVAVSPIPIIAVIVMLLSARGRANSAAFLAGWIVGVVGACVVLLLISGSLDTGSGGSPSTTSSVIKLVLGAFLLVLARRNVRGRAHGDGEAPLPRWLAEVDTLTPVKAAGLGVGLSAVNPKNLVLMAGAMVSVAQANLDVGQETVVVAVFAVIAVSTVLLPVVVDWVAGARAQPRLDAVRGWLAQNNAVVMGVLLLVIGVVLIGKGISGLSA